MSDCTFTIEKHIAVIGKSGGDGKITKELNIVKWGNNPAKFDIRAWNADHTKAYKGIALDKEEAKALLAALSVEIGENN